MLGSTGQAAVATPLPLSIAVGSWHGSRQWVGRRVMESRRIVAKINAARRCGRAGQDIDGHGFMDILCLLPASPRLFGSTHLDLHQPNSQCRSE